MEPKEAIQDKKKSESAHKILPIHTSKAASNDEITVNSITNRRILTKKHRKERFEARIDRFKNKRHPH